ncbi:MAG: hypothetical protein CSA35_01775 [Dethiosulfovibrio peptidovorans]|nr:MAG: hypothetical protein CSA35_01775 [Dethiosulfovibrio peptidovorans]
MQGILTTLPIVFIITLGWGLRHLGKIDGQEVSKVNSVLFWCIMPTILFRGGLDIDASVFFDGNYLTALYGSFVAVIALALCTVRVLRFPQKRGAVFVLGAIRSNVVFIGIPLVSVLLGDSGLRALYVYLSVGMLVYNSLPIACAQMVMEGHFSLRTVRNALGRTIRTPLIIAGVLGILLSLTGLKDFLPGWFLQGIDLIADAGSGLALIVIGASLQLRGLLRSLRTTWLLMGYKLILLPIVLTGAFWLFPPQDPLLGKVSILIGGLSPAFNTFIMAAGMEMDSEYAADYVATSTVVGVAAAALWIEILF